MIFLSVHFCFAQRKRKKEEAEKKKFEKMLERKRKAEKTLNELNRQINAKI
jgi:hypothetical protein